jgi:hypothetical protein
VFPAITQAWLNARAHVIQFVVFPAEVRRVIYGRTPERPSTGSCAALAGKRLDILRSVISCRHGRRGRERRRLCASCGACGRGS